MARILIVEDSSAMRAYVRSVLEDQELGFSAEVDVVEAASGFDALRLLPRGEFELLITDINMPDINGLELIRFVRDNERYAQLAIVIISTQAGERDVQRGLALGADTFLAKPFKPEVLREAVVSALKKRRAVEVAPEARGGGSPGEPGGEARR
jgi:two-component system chemotaxis response regulator CheY